MEPVLKVNELTKIYKEGHGIKKVSFEIGEGDILGLLGLKGSGKTTIMKIITGLSYADEGSVEILGNDILKEELNTINNIGCLIETPATYDYLTARENLKLAANYYREIKKPRIDDILTQTGLIQYADERVKNFSVRMKLRLGIALALISNPKLVILDEPTNGLDIEGILEVKQMIVKQAKLGTAFLISSHLAYEIELICNKVVILNEGNLLSTASIEKILDEHGTLEQYFLKYISGKDKLI